MKHILKFKLFENTTLDNKVTFSSDKQLELCEWLADWINSNRDKLKYNTIRWDFYTNPQYVEPKTEPKTFKGHLLGHRQDKTAVGSWNRLIYGDRKITLIEKDDILYSIIHNDSKIFFVVDMNDKHYFHYMDSRFDDVDLSEFEEYVFE